MSERPIIVICPSGWTLEKLFDPVRQAFESAGYQTIYDAPGGYPETDPAIPPPLNFDVQRLRDKILGPLVSGGKEVVLFMHSYGGFYGASSVEGLSRKERAAKGLEGGIVGLIFISGFVATKGMSAISTMGFDPDALPGWIDHDLITGMVGVKKEHAKAMLFHEMSDEEAEELAKSLPKRPYSCMSLPVLYDPFHDPNYGGLCGYIHTGADRILPYELQQSFVETGGIKHTMLLPDSSHSPHIEDPQSLAETFIQLLQTIT